MNSMLRSVIHWLCYVLVVSVVRVLNCLPLSVRLKVVTALVYPVFGLMPQFRRAARRNLSIAFPDRSEQWREEVRLASVRSFARLVVDFLRLRDLDRAWVAAHVQGAPDCEPDRISQMYPHRPILYGVGHLGSFELMAFNQALRGYPLDFIVRDFKNPFIEAWVKHNRERSGNLSISRKGALKRIIKSLRAGRSAGMLFDQNVTKNYAVFVDWFGYPAATTRALAVAALRTRAIIVCAALINSDHDHYFEDGAIVDCAEVYDDENLSDEEKTRIITQKVSDYFVDLIRKYPEHWFWFHRRWKTRPAGEKEDFYNLK